MDKPAYRHSETLGMLSLPSRPAPGSWWLDLDREAFRREVQTHAQRMHGSKEARQASRYLTWDADSS